MSNASTLLPTSIALSSDAAIEAILSDIPLFCEGIMGIGVFTFLFFTKQVNLLSVFLYGSSFIAFAAATLDLGQVLARGPQDTAKGIGLDTVAGFIYTREVFLALAVGSLDLFFWKLVAQSPRDEIPSQVNSSARNMKGSQHTHSASWNYWGTIGIILKWGSLSALLSVPLLQILWRTMLGQRKYGCIYVAETIIQTSVTFVFVLKLMLNVYSSTQVWWRAFRLHAIPIAALFIGAGLGIGNIIVFAFTETSLGRLLRAIEVYCLMVFSLYTTFQVVQSDRPPSETRIPATNLNTEKFQGDNLLPYAYSGAGYNVKNDASSQLKIVRRPNINSRVPNLSWMLSRRRSSLSIQTLQRSDIRIPEPSIDFVAASSQENDNGSRRLAMRPDLPQSPSSPSKKPESPKSDRPLTSVSLSYYTMEEGNKLMNRDSQPPNRREDISVDQETRFTEASSLALPSGFPLVGSQQGSISSMDEIFRQQNELDKSIAALRLFSMQDFSIESKPTLPEPTATTTGSFVQSKSTLKSTKTESISNRSDFSLSIFPEPPPIVQQTQTLTETKYSFQDGDEDANSFVVPSVPVERPEVGRKEVLPISVPFYESMSLPSSSTQKGFTVPFGSAGTQYNVPSFIGGYSDPKNATQSVIPSDDLNSDLSSSSDGEATTLVMLRPMILASTVLASPLEQEPDVGRKTAPSSYNTEPGRLTSYRDSNGSQNLRPLLLGKPISSIPPTMPSATMVPLAQRRRQRGGTLTNAQRPVIGAPRINSQTEAIPGAFERPRPPPGLRR